MSADPTTDLQRAAREYVLRYLPGRLVRRVRLDLDGEEQVILPVVYVAVLRAGGVPGADPDGATIRSAVLECLADADHPLKATVLARRCGKDYTGAFPVVAPLPRQDRERHGESLCLQLDQPVDPRLKIGVVLAHANSGAPRTAARLVSRAISFWSSSGSLSRLFAPS